MSAPAETSNNISVGHGAQWTCAAFKEQDTGQVALGPVANEATFRTVALAAHAYEHEDVGHGAVFGMNHMIGRALAGMR